MIYNDEFVWLHFPKCAGVKIENLFRKYLFAEPGVFQDIIDPQRDKAASWHDSVANRTAHNPDFILGERTVICSIRRLPSWLESRYNFEYERSPELPHNPELLLGGKFLESSGRINHADNYIEKYLPQVILSTGKVRFLRMEHFEEDFIEIFSKYLDVSIIPREEYVQRANTSRNHIPVEILHSLRTSRDIYTKCPKWKAIEQLAYASS